MVSDYVEQGRHAYTCLWLPIIGASENSKFAKMSTL